MFGRVWNGESGSPFFMKQQDAAYYIQKYLAERGLTIHPTKNNRWIVFEHKAKQIGVDLSSGVWIRANAMEDWRRISKPFMVSGVLQAIEFLTKV